MKPETKAHIDSLIEKVREDLTAAEAPPQAFKRAEQQIAPQ